MGTRFLLVAFAAAAACSGPTPEEKPAEVTVTVSENPHNRFSRILDVQTDGAEVVVRHSMGSTPAQPPGEVLVLGLAADQTHTLTVLVDGQEAETVEVTTAPLPEEWQRCSVSGVAADEGVVCTNGWDENGATYFCVDRDGEPVWSLAHPEGVILLAVRSLPNGGFVAVGDDRSLLAVFDARGELIQEVDRNDLQSQLQYEHSWIDMHEVIAISEGQWAGAVAFLTATGDVYDDDDVIANGVIVYDPATEKVLWDWSAHGALGDNQSIDPDKLLYSRQGLLEDQIDWLHANALVHRVRDDGGEDMLISLRHQDWIIAVDTETGAIRWRLGAGGDFSGSDDAWFYQQHAPELRVVDGETRLMVFDNGTLRPDGEAFSRVVELALDEAAMTATVTGEHEVAFVEGHGDADLLPGGDRMQYVIGWGDAPYVAEVGWPSGEEQWRLTCPEVHELYRATYFPSLYERTWWYNVTR